MSTVDINTSWVGIDPAINPVMHRISGRATQSPLVMQAEIFFRDIVPLVENASNVHPSPKKRQRDDDPLRPKLSEPKLKAADGIVELSDEMNAERRNNDLLLDLLAEVLEQGSWRRLASNANAAVQRDAARIAGDAQLVEDYDLAQRAVADKLNELSELVTVLSGLKERSAVMDSKLQEIEGRLVTLEYDAPAYKVALRNRSKLLEQIKQLGVDLMQAEDQANTLQGKAITLQEEVDCLMQQFDQGKVTLPPQTAAKDIGNMERMLMLMTQLGELMLNTAEVSLDTQRSIVTEQEKVRINKLAQDAAKVDEEMKKAEVLNKTVGYVGKVLGGVVMAAGIIGALFTGGASLVLAGVGLALMFADYIYQEVTGTSVIAEVMKPIVEFIQPMVAFIMDFVSNVLEKCGMDPSTARIVGTIVVVVALLVGLAALALIGVGGATVRLTSNLMSKLGTAMSRVFEKTALKMTAEIIKQGASKITGQISRALSNAYKAVMRLFGIGGDTLVRTQIVGQQLVRGSVAGFSVQTVTTGGLTVAEKGAEVNAEEAMASMRFTSTELTYLQEMYSELLGQCRNSYSAAMTIFDSNSKAIVQFSSNGSAVASAIGAAGAV